MSMSYPFDSSAMLALAIEHHRGGRLVEAESAYAEIVQRDPVNADALHLLGVVAYQTGRHDTALALISKALTLNPLAPEYHNSLGGVRQAMGEETEAICLYLHAIHLKDDYLEPYHNIIRLRPAAVEVRFNLGCVLQRLGRIQEAIEQYTKVLDFDPNHAKALNNRGVAFHALGRLDEAVADYREAVRIEPDYAEAYNNLGQTLHDQGLLEEAIEACHAALSLRPDFAGASYNTGRSLHEQGRYEEAIEQFRHVIQIAPGFADAYYNWGVALSGLGRYKEAIGKYKDALRIDSNSVQAHANLGLLLLLTEDYQKGWGEYEWRMQRPDWRNVNTVYPDIPRWDGSESRDRTILVQAEQGFGDIIQFVRYLPMVAARCGKVILEAPQILHSLLKTLPDISEVVEANPENARSADFAVHLLSLPGIFDTRIDSIPSVFPYLSVPAQRLVKWREKIPSHGFRVGITWSGNPANSENRERSCNLHCFAKLAAIPGVTLFSLQKGEAAEQLKSQAHGMNIVDLGPMLDDFSDTAAAIMHLDLVVSVDTALVHLAGALGHPVWTLRYHTPYWVWGLTGPVTPWYPSMRIFRQQRPGDWDGVFDEVGEALAQHLSAVTASQYPCEERTEHMSNSQVDSSSTQSQVARYRPDVFLVQNQQQAREIILTPEFGMTTEERWEFETGYLAPEIMKFLEPSQESLILDFGCGLGRLSKALLGLAPCRILGVDISVSMRQLAPGYVVDENFSVVSHQVFEAMVTNGLRVNAAIALWVLQHCPQVDREVALIHQALSPGGRFYVLNNKHSAIPTEIGWVSDGTDLLAILQSRFQTLKVGSLPPGVTHQELSRHSFIAELRKEAEK